jgi:S1-C subfamily serine protease
MKESIMFFLPCLLFLPGQIETKDSADFSRTLQVRAVTATVRIHNPANKMEGSGVIVGKGGPFVYILTAHHLVGAAEQLDITTFTEQSHPKADKVYRSAKVVAKSADLRDLALVRMVCDDKMVGMLPICPVAEMPKAEKFLAITVGCGDGQAPSALIEKVLGKKKIRRKAGEDSASVWEMDGAVVKGRSGGPLVDKRGYVVGICSGTNDGKGYYTHPEEIHRFLKQNVFAWLAEKGAAEVPKESNPK